MGKIYEKIGKSTAEQIESKSFRAKVEKFDSLVKVPIIHSVKKWFFSY